MKPKARERKRKLGLSHFLSRRKGGDPIPESVYKAAYAYSKGKKVEELQIPFSNPFSPVKEDYSAVKAFLRTLLEEDNEAALATLERYLVNDPLALDHPVVWSMIYSWFHFKTSYQGFMFANPDLEKWLCRLVIAWAEGVTLGEVKATCVQPHQAEKSGRPPLLFPALKERQGWLGSDAKRRAVSKSLQFLHDYENLHADLKALQWKTESKAY